MKWVLLSVAVFIGSIAVFIAIPRPALVWDGELHRCLRWRVGPGETDKRFAAIGNRWGWRLVRDSTARSGSGGCGGRARVIDGDTIDVRSVRIRLFGIDAPESAQAAERGVAGGRAVSGRRGRCPGTSVVNRSRAKSAIKIGTGASSPSVTTTDRTSTPGWCTRVGRWPTALLDGVCGPGGSGEAREARDLERGLRLALELAKG